VPQRPAGRRRYDSLMRSFVVLLALLLFSACASSDGFSENQNFDCAPGQPITIVAGIDSIRASGTEVVDDQHTVSVIVANNSHQDIVVKYVRVDQRPDEGATYRLETGYRTVDEIVAEGEEVDLKVPMSGRSVAPVGETMRRNRSILLDVSVGLGNGDRYHCEFEIPVR